MLTPRGILFVTLFSLAVTFSATGCSFSLGGDDDDSSPVSQPNDLDQPDNEDDSALTSDDDDFFPPGDDDDTTTGDLTLVELADGTLLVAPESAVPPAAIISAAPIASPVRIGLTPVGQAYDFTPDGLAFNSPATLTLSYDPALIPDGSSELEIVIFGEYTNGYWVDLSGSVDTDSNTVTTEILHFSGFVPVITNCIDADSDGYGDFCDLGDDCDETNDKINTGAGDWPEDGIDQNCDGSDPTFTLDPELICQQQSTPQGCKSASVCDITFYFSNDFVLCEPTCVDNDEDGHWDMINSLFEESECLLADDFCASNPNAWTEQGCYYCYDSDYDGRGVGCDMGPDACEDDEFNWLPNGCANCIDMDSDGFGENCDLGPDCDDGNSDINPATREWPDDGIDQDCDGTDATNGGLPIDCSGPPPYYECLANVDWCYYQEDEIVEGCSPICQDNDADGFYDSFPDICPVAGNYCAEHPELATCLVDACSAAPATGQISGEAFVFFASMPTPAVGSVLQLVDNSTGTAIPGQSVAVSSDGSFTFSDVPKPAGCLYGIKIEPDVNFHSSYQWNISFNSDSHTIQAIPETLYAGTPIWSSPTGDPVDAEIIPNPSNGWIVGNIFHPSYSNFPIGCATFDAGGEGTAAYFTSSSPTPPSLLNETFDGVGIFMIADLSPGLTTLTASGFQLDGFPLGTTTTLDSLQVKIMPASITWVDFLISGPSNPTPIECIH